jgi:hypothetical protein
MHVNASLTSQLMMVVVHRVPLDGSIWCPAKESNGSVSALGQENSTKHKERPRAMSWDTGSQFWVGCASDVMPVALYIETKFCIGYNLPCRLYTSIEPNNSKKIYYKWASTCAKFCPRVDQLLRMMCLFKLKTFVKTDYVLCLMQCGAQSLVEMGLGCSQLQKSMC